MTDQLQAIMLLITMIYKPKTKVQLAKVYCSK